MSGYSNISAITPGFKNQTLYLPYLAGLYREGIATSKLKSLISCYILHNPLNWMLSFVSSCQELSGDPHYAIIAPVCVVVRTSVHIVHMEQKIASKTQHNLEHNRATCPSATSACVNTALVPQYLPQGSYCGKSAVFTLKHQ